MSFFNKTKEGDTIMIRISNSVYEQITLNEKEFINTSYGQIPHSLFINKSYNSSIEINKKYKNRNIETKFFILKPSFSHLFKTNERQTQILFMHDIGLIIYNLNLVNKIIIEAGTGSGTLTKALSSVAKRVYTFEIDECRYLKNKEQLINYENINIQHLDICKINLQDVVNEKIDRVFLDMPNPELLSNQISKILQRGDLICIFVPSVEQIQLVVSTYKTNFKIKIFENISREILSKVYLEGELTKRGIGYKNQEYLHTGYLIFGIKL